MAGNEWTVAEANVPVAELLERARPQGPQVIVDEKGRYFDVIYVPDPLTGHDDLLIDREVEGVEGDDGNDESHRR